MPLSAENDPLRPMLREAEADLTQRLEEACSVRDVKDESTGELMRLEETLLEAARAAKQAVSVRRRLRTLGGGAGDADSDDGAGDDEADGPSADATTGPGKAGGTGDETTPARPHVMAGDGEPSSVRDFVDEDRVEWRVWEVIPGQTRASARSEQHHHQLGDYQDGWLAFEAVGTGHRRRLRDYPDQWNALSNDDLERLLARAEIVRSARRISTTNNDNDRSDAPRA